MGSVPIDLARARTALAQAGAATVAGVRSIRNAGAPVPGLEWTARETAAHLVTVLGAFTASARGELFEATGLNHSTPEGRRSRINAHLIKSVGEEDPGALADLIAAGMGAFLGATAGATGGEILATPWYGDGASLHLNAATCIVLGELLIHGRDIAAVEGQRGRIDPDQADLIIRGTTSMMPMLVNPRTSRGVHATIEVRIRGGVAFTLVLRDGVATIQSEPPGSVDCHISADPVAWLLLAYGRAGQWGPIARGQLLTWGRKPWLALRSRGFFLDP